MTEANGTKTEPMASASMSGAASTAESHAKTVNGQNMTVGKIDLLVINQTGATQKDPEDDKEAEIHERILPDPTKELPFHRSGKFNFNEYKTEKLAKSLERDNLLILTGFDTKVLTHAGFAIIRHFNPHLGESTCGIEKRQVDFLSKSDEETPVFADLLYAKIASESPCVILVDIETESARSFVESMPDVGTQIESARGILHDRNRFVLMLGAPHHLPKNDCYDDIREEIDLLSVLEHYFPEQHEILHQQLTEQRSHGLWEQEDYNFYEELKQFIRTRSLQNEIESRQNPEAVRELRSERTNVLRELLTGPDELVKAVLFTATFFRDLAIPDFNRVLELLLEDQNQEKEASNSLSWRPTSPITIWKTEHTRVLKECNLDFIQPDKSATDQPFGEGLREPVIGFTGSFLREDLHRAFWSFAHITYLELFDRIWNRALIFDRSATVRRSVTYILKETISVNPQRHNHNWLLDLILNADPSPSESQDKERRTKEHIRVILEHLGGVFYDQLGHIIRVALEVTKLHGSVNTFFHELLDKGFYEEVRKLVWRLRFTKDFDAFRWWKELLNRDDGLREDVCKNIRLMSYTGSSHFTRVIGNIEEWLFTKDIPQYDAARRSAPHLMIHICLNITFHKYRKTYSTWPPENTILAAFNEERRDKLEERLLQGLYHRTSRFILKGYQKNNIRRFSKSYLLGKGFKSFPGDSLKKLNEIASSVWGSSSTEDGEGDLGDSEGIPEFFLHVAILTASWSIDLLGFEGDVPSEATSIFNRITRNLPRKLKELTDNLPKVFQQRALQLLRLSWQAITQCQIDLLTVLRAGSNRGRQTESLLTYGRISDERKIVQRLSKEFCTHWNEGTLE